MGYRHDRGEILDAATAVLAESGLAGLTYRTVGARLGIPDRTVVYYFPRKDDLVVAAVERGLHDLRDVVTAALDGATGDERDLAGRAWRALRTPAGEQAFGLALEVLGPAARGVEPYRSAAAGLVDLWTDLVHRHLAGVDPTRRERAAGAVALLDGLLLIRAVAGTARADAAARGLGI
ncbi:MAG: TetR/AcrR family transcriptional regulator [Kineosporiaceae bacterium]